MSSTYTYKGLTITWFHHASFLIESGEIAVYIDPFKVGGGPAADLILLTHDHFDHTDKESIGTLRAAKTQVLAAESVRKSQIADVYMKPGESAKIGECLIRAVPAYNVGKPFHQKESGNVGFVLEVGGVAIYHAGDTDWIPEMTGLSGTVDVALLPIGGTYTMDVKEAVQVVAAIKPKIVIPMHYNFLDETRVTPADIEYFVNESKQYCEQVVVLAPKP